MIQAGTRFAPSILSQMAKRQEAGADDIWPVPDLFNIADMCCDRWAVAQPDRVALIDVRDDAPQNTGLMLNSSRGHKAGSLLQIASHCPRRQNRRTSAARPRSIDRTFRSLPHWGNHFAAVYPVWARCAGLSPA